MSLSEKKKIFPGGKTNGVKVQKVDQAFAAN